MAARAAGEETARAPKCARLDPQGGKIECARGSNAQHITDNRTWRTSGGTLRIPQPQA